MSNPKILVKHTRIEISDYELGDQPALEYKMSVYDTVKHRSFAKGVMYDEENKILLLPRGMDIPYLEELFFTKAVVDHQHDPYQNTNPIPIKYLTRDDRQTKSLRFILGIGEYQYTATKSQLALNLNVGAGKTFVAVAAICVQGSRAIVITSAINWLQQWKEKILEYTNLSPDKIYMVQGVGSMNKLFYKNPTEYQIFLASHTTLKSFGDRYGWDQLADWFKYIKVSLKIYDECHLYFDNMIRVDFHSNTYKTLYLTATPARSDKDENIIYKIYFKNVPAIDLFDEKNDPHVHYLAIHYNSHPTPKDVSKAKNIYGFNRNKYMSYVIEKPNFFMMTDILIDKCLNIPGKILIYIGTQEGIDAVVAHVKEKFPFIEPLIGIYTSYTDPEIKPDQLYKKFIFSTTKSCGAAQDIKDLRVTIVLNEPFKSEVVARQSLGRCREDNTLYIDLVDDGFYYTKIYYKCKQPIYTKYAKSYTDEYYPDERIEEEYARLETKLAGLTNGLLCRRIFKRPGR